MNAKKIIRCLQFNQIIFFCDFIRGAPAYPNELVLLDNQSTLSKAGKVTFDLGHSVLGVLGKPWEKHIYIYAYVCTYACNSDLPTSKSACTNRATRNVIYLSST